MAPSSPGDFQCALVLLAFFTASPASAQKLDVATIKCGDFIKYNKETIGNLMVWLSGYYTGEDDEAVIDFDKDCCRRAEAQRLLRAEPQREPPHRGGIYRFRAVRGTEPGEGKRRRGARGGPPA